MNLLLTPKAVGGFLSGFSIRPVGWTRKDGSDGHALFIRPVDWTRKPTCGRPNTSLIAHLVIAFALTSAGVGLAQTVDSNLWITNGPVSSIVTDGNTIYVGGRFTLVGPASGEAWETRNNIAAFDAATGVATPWNPDANGPVLTLALSGGTVYAGGTFTSIGGQPRSQIAALDASSGAATSWDPNATGSTPIGQFNAKGVLALAVSGSTVYAGGYFSAIGGQPRERIAALDAATGVATAWAPGIYGCASPSSYGPYVTSLAVDGATVYVGGYFCSIGTPLQRVGAIAALDAASGAATAWRGSYPSQVPWVLAVSGSTVYAGGDALAAIDAISGATTVWDPHIGRDVRALAVGGDKVYVGGQFTSIAGQARNRLTAFDEGTGAITLWNPDVGSSNHFSGVLALAVSGNKVYVGGDFPSIGGQPHANFAAVSAVDTPVATLLAQFDATTSANGIELRWSFGDASRVTSVAVERAANTAGPWVAITPELHNEAGVTVALDHAAAESGQYFYRILVQLSGGGQQVFGPVSASYREAPTQSDLKLLSPNPTSGGTQMRYSVARAGRVRLEVLDASGRVEETLADRFHTPGRYVVSWDGAGRRGRSSPGLYFVRLMTPDQVAMRKLAIVW